MKVNLLLRKLRAKAKTNTINVIGLTLGIMSSCFILLYISYSISFDKYHKDYQQIYRATERSYFTEIPRDKAYTPPALKAAIEGAYADIDVLRLNTKTAAIYIGNNNFRNVDIYYADENLPSFFELKMLQGNVNQSLSDSKSIILSENAAKRYFGDKDPIGEEIRLNPQTVYTVAGVYEDWKSNSHMHPEMIVSMHAINPANELDKDWWSGFYTYLKLPYSINKNTFIDGFTANMSDKVKYGDKRKFSLQAISDIHLYSHKEGEVEGNHQPIFLYIFGIMGVLILIMACFNFMNLSIASYSKEAKELGVKKILGASKWQLSGIFFKESFLLCFIALVLSIITIETSISYFNQYFPGIESFYEFNRVYILGSFAALSLLIAILSASFPAIFFSSLPARDILKLKLPKSKYSIFSKNTLIAVQFVITCLMVSSSILVYRQSNLMKQMDLGFDKENICVIELSKDQLNKAEVIMANLNNYASVTKTAISGGVPSQTSLSEFPYILDGQKKGTLPNILTWFVGYDFFDMYKIEMADGRNFSRLNSTDKEKAFIINETAAKTFAFEQPIGENFAMMQFDGKQMAHKEGKIIGIVKDFKYEGVQTEVAPIVFEISPSEFFLSKISIKYKGDKEEIASIIDKEWEALGEESSAEFIFIDQVIKNQNKKYTQINKMIFLFTVLMICLSCLGLLGLVAFNVERKSKEVGIRLVLGGGFRNILWLFSWRYVKLLIIANMISVPMVSFLMSQFLQTFAYRIAISSFSFALTLIITVLITFFTIGTVVYFKANSKLIETLKYE